MKRLLVAVAGIAIAAHAALADEFPSRVITIISPYPPGGVTSDTARLLADGMAQRLGQPVIVENVAGAGGTIGVRRVAHAKPDGYTLLVHNLALASSGALFRNLAYDTGRDLAGISLINTSPLVIVGRKSLPANTLPELLNWLKAAKVVRFSAPGIGNIGHLCGTLFSRQIGVPFDMIPYRGGAPAQQDLIAGHIDMACSTSQGVVGPIKGGQLKGFGVTSRDVYKPLPDLPSLPGSGMERLEVRYWHGMYAPAGTPRPVIEKLNAAVQEVLKDPKVIEIWERLGIDVYPVEGRNPEAALSFLRAEIERWSAVIRENNIVAE